MDILSPRKAAIPFDLSRRRGLITFYMAFLGAYLLCSARQTYTSIWSKSEVATLIWWRPKKGVCTVGKLYQKTIGPFMFEFMWLWPVAMLGGQVVLWKPMDCGHVESGICIQLGPCVVSALLHW